MSAFGAFAAPKPPGQTSMFGSTTQQPSTASAFGGFGQSTQQTQPTQTSTGLFGGSTFGQNQQQQQPQAATQAPSTGLFGQPQSQQQPTQNAFGTTGLFGNSNQMQQPQAGQAQQTQQPSLFSGFGSTANANAGQATSSQPTGLFGNTNTATTSQPQQSSTGLGLFGSTTSAPQTSGFGAFGTANTSSNQQPGGTSLGFGASTFGQSAQQPAQIQQSGAPLFTKNTKFNDLPEEIKKKLETIDAHIQGRVQISTELKQNKLGEEPVKGTGQIRNVHKDLVNAINNLRADIASMRELRAKMDQAVQDTIIATRIIDASRNSGQQQGSVYLKNYANFPLEFFTRIAEQLRERLLWLNNTVEQIERKLASEVNHVSITPQAISATLQAQHSSFIALANKTAALDAELQKIKNTYRQLWRAKTGSARDPFNEHDRTSGTSSEFGLEGLSVQ